MAVKTTEGAREGKRRVRPTAAARNSTCPAFAHPDRERAPKYEFASAPARRPPRVGHEFQADIPDLLVFRDDKERKAFEAAVELRARKLGMRRVE